MPFFIEKTVTSQVGCLFLREEHKFLEKKKWSTLSLKTPQQRHALQINKDFACEAKNLGKIKDFAI